MEFGRHSCLCQYLKAGSIVPDPPEGETHQVSPSIAIASKFRNVKINALLSYTNTMNFLDMCERKCGSPSDIRTKWWAEWSGIPGNPEQRGKKSAVQVTKICHLC